MRKIKNFFPLKGILSSLILCLLFCPAMMAADDSLENEPKAEDRNLIQDKAVEFTLTPLNTDSSISSELMRWMQAKSGNSDFSIQINDYNSASRVEFQRMPRTGAFGKSLFTTSLVTMTALNIADGYSTLKAMQYDNLLEANPIMSPFTKNTFLFTAVKVGFTAYNLYFLRKLYKKNKTLAWVLSIATNMAMTYVVMHNFKMIRQAQGR